MLSYRKTFSTNAEGKLITAQITFTSLYKLTRRYNNVYILFKAKISWTNYILGSWSQFSFEELEPESLRMFLSFLNMRLLRKDFPKFKKHLLEYGKIKTQMQISFPSDFHFRILHHSWRTKF